MMKRAVALLLATILMCLSLPVLAETNVSEANISSVEEAAAILSQYREEGVRNFTLHCDKDTFSVLSAKNFEILYRLCYAVGIQDPSVSYRGNDLMFSKVLYEKIISFAEVTSMDAARQVITDFVEQGLKGFTLYCDETTYTTLVTDREIYAILAQHGMEKFQLSSNKATGMCYVRRMTAFKTPWAVAMDAFDAGDIISSWREQGEKAFTLVFEPEVYKAMTNDDRRMMEFIGGIEKGNASRDPFSGTLSYSDVIWTKEPSFYCTTEEEIINAIRGMGLQGSRAFRLMLAQPLWDTVTANSFTRLSELEAQAGMGSSDLRYSGVSRQLLFSNAKITVDAKVFATAQEATEYAIACAADEEKQITLFLTEEAYNDLMDGVSAFNLFATDAGIYSLAARAGIFRYGLSYNRAAKTVNLTNVQYFPGRRIADAVAEGTEASLSARLQETLDAARKMADACRGADPVETARLIHDKLCETVVYTDLENTEEDDCCIGALLLGQANCDGYSDAMYLVGTLAGLEMGYQHGDAKDGGLSSLFSTHIWNLICIDGTWRLIDVTWDDNEGARPGYLWFNIGLDRAARTHTWIRSVSLDLAETTDTAVRPVAEYRVLTADDMTAAAADACAKGLRSFDIYLEADSTLNRITAPDALQHGITGSCSYIWVESLGCLSVQR